MLRQSMRKLSRATNNSKEENNMDPSEPTSFLQRIIMSLIEKDYESVHSILTNFGIVSALLLSILIGLIVSVPIEESVRGDILSLSLSSPHFRCHFKFASPATNTIEICSPSYTIEVFGTTDATIICRDGPTRIYKPQGFKDGVRSYSSPFYCAADIPRLTRRDYTTSTGKVSGCTSGAFKEAYQMAKNITEDDYLDYLMEEIPTSNFGWFGWPGKFDTCKPSGRVATLGFKSLLYLMLALFWDLYLLVSLTFTSASTDSAEMKRWWISGGAVVTLLVLSMLLQGTIHFLQSLEYLAIIRFPCPYDQSLFKIDFMDAFFRYGIYVALVVMGIHFLLVRLWGNLSSKKLGNSDKQPCDEILQIQDETNRKLLQKDDLDARTLIEFLNDTILLNSVLLDAGIKTSGDRLKIITTLKAIDKEDREGTYLHSAGLLPGMESSVPPARFVQDGSGVPQTPQITSPGMHGQC